MHTLFEWSSPERIRSLSIIPNEIYLHIFKYIAPQTAHLTAQQIRTLTDLSCVCKFFANCCLPRIYETMSFSDLMFNSRKIGSKASLTVALCSRIAAKEPLALALANAVRTCYFSRWGLDSTGSWIDRLSANKYIVGMSHMKNIRKLHFFKSFMDAEHFSAIASLPSLLELSFDSCRFLLSDSDVELEKSTKIKVSRLWMFLSSSGRAHCPLLAVIDGRYLHTLHIDYSVFIRVNVDWQSFSALRVLRFYSYPIPLTVDEYMDRVHVMLARAPPFLEVLSLVLNVESGMVEEPEVVQRMFNNPGWKNLTHLRSLTLRVARGEPLLQIVLSALESTNFFPNLQLFTLTDDTATCFEETPPIDVRCIIHDRLGPSSRIKYRCLRRTGFRFEDGRWTPIFLRTTGP